MDTFTIESPKAARSSDLLIWLVVGDKPGDNAQIEIIADGLGLAYEIRRVLPKEQYVLGKPRFKASLYHLDARRSDRLEPPWPDLIITIGRRPSMAALWIQQQSAGHSKIVLLGRPKRWLERFSLVVIPAQYSMPDDPRILALDLPLMRSSQPAIERVKEVWRGKFSQLPRPLTALLIGGQTKPFRFDAGVARQLLKKAVVATENGCLYVTTSRRTPPAVVDSIQRNLPANAKLYCWSADDQDNPYLGLLGLADRFIVTGDSISMMIEVARLGKPLAICALPYQKSIEARFQQWLSKLLQGEKTGNFGDRFIFGLVTSLRKLKLIGYSRDLTAVHQLLYNKQLAVPLGNNFLAGGKKVMDELPVVVERIRQLFHIN